MRPSSSQQQFRLRGDNAVASLYLTLTHTHTHAHLLTNFSYELTILLYGFPPCSSSAFWIQSLSLSLPFSIPFLLVVGTRWLPLLLLTPVYAPTRLRPPGGPSYGWLADWLVGYRQLVVYSRRGREVPFFYIPQTTDWETERGLYFQLLPK